MSPLDYVGFLDWNYHYKLQATQIPHDALGWQRSHTLVEPALPIVRVQSSTQSRSYGAGKSFFMKDKKIEHHWFTLHYTNGIVSMQFKTYTGHGQVV